MKAKKVLFVTQEMTPFVPENPKATFGTLLPKAILENNHEIRVFTPKWGNINERRNQLHEVIRLSGMNIIVNETDHPLIIKVASMLQARTQIYFIDNDDYFMKRLMALDENGVPYNDNGERSIFYARGVLETVKKTGWAPDIVHCQGWIGAVAPLLIKKVYADEPSFANCKVVYALSKPDFKGSIGENFIKSLPLKEMAKEDLDEVFNGKCEYNELMKLAIKYSDAVVLEDDKVSKTILNYVEKLGKPILPVQNNDTFQQAYSDFYDSLMS